ncbi:MAG TPA: hypothetical protein VGI63_04980, partial [Verrucomicrobiae bacterium]
MKPKEISSGAIKNPRARRRSGLFNFAALLAMILALTPFFARADLTFGSDGFAPDKILVKPKPGVNLSGLNLSLGV